MANLSNFNEGQSDPWAAVQPDPWALDDFTLTQAFNMYETDMKDLMQIIAEETQPENEPPVKFETEDNQRFGETVNMNDISNLQNEQKSKNTTRNTNWGSKAWEDWVINRSKGPCTQWVPDFRIMSAEQINYFMASFVMEVKTKSGKPYSPSS